MAARECTGAPTRPATESTTADTKSTRAVTETSNQSRRCRNTTLRYSTLASQAICQNVRLRRKKILTSKHCLGVYDPGRIFKKDICPCCQRKSRCPHVGDVSCWRDHLKND